MTRISYGSVTPYSVDALLVEMNETSIYTSAYIYCNGQSSGNLANNSTGQTSTSVVTFSGLTPNTTYTLSWSATTAAGSTGSGSTTFTTLPPPRPSNFSWYNSKVSGSSFNISASEWNAFCIRINDFRYYKNLSDYPFTYVYTGNTFTASHYNEVRSAISDMSPNTSVPPYRYSGDIIYANDINNLVSSLNSIT